MSPHTVVGVALVTRTSKKWSLPSVFMSIKNLMPAFEVMQERLQEPYVMCSDDKMCWSHI